MFLCFFKKNAQTSIHAIGDIFTGIAEAGLELQLKFNQKFWWFQSHNCIYRF